MANKIVCYLVLHVRCRSTIIGVDEGPIRQLVGGLGRRG